MGNVYVRRVKKEETIQHKWVKRKNTHASWLLQILLTLLCHHLKIVLLYII